MLFHNIVTKGLTQITMGTPQAIYNGGLLRGTVRRFDQDRTRPGLPKDVAALVDRLSPDGVEIYLVNTNGYETHNVIVRAGAFGEHTFTTVRFRESGKDGETAVPINGLRGAATAEHEHPHRCRA